MAGLQRDEQAQEGVPAMGREPPGSKAVCFAGRCGSVSPVHGFCSACREQDSPVESPLSRPPCQGDSTVCPAVSTALDMSPVHSEVRKCTAEIVRLS